MHPPRVAAEDGFRDPPSDNRNLGAGELHHPQPPVAESGGQGDVLSEHLEARAQGVRGAGSSGVECKEFAHEASAVEAAEQRKGVQRGAEQG